MSQLVKPLTWVLGVVLILVGVLGFFMPSPLLGIFAVDTVHNLIHVVSGAVALIAAGTGEQNSRMYLIVFGLIYGLVTVLGFVMESPLLGLISVNMADNYLHLVIAAVSLAVGFGGARKSAMMG